MCPYYYGVAAFLSCSLLVFLIGPLSGGGAHMEGWLREVVWLKTGWGGGEGRSILFLACRSGFPYGQMIALPRAREAVESTQQEMASDLLLAAVSNYVSFQ